MESRIAVLIAAVCGTPLGPAAAEFAVQKRSDTVVDDRTLTVDGRFGQAINGKSFQQDMIVTHAGWQYLAYYGANRQVAIARRREAEPQWEVARFSDYTFDHHDSHNTISLAVCTGDGTIHLAWDHHGDPLHYRVSSPGAANEPEATPWGPQLFGPIRDRLEAEIPPRLTYPRFLQTPGGGLHFFYRLGGSGNGDRYMVDYDPRRGVWSMTRRIDSGRVGSYEDSLGRSATRCSYPNGYTYGPLGRLHATWVWREDANEANHDLVYVCSLDSGKTWQNSDGQRVAAPVTLSTRGSKVAEIPRTMGLVNTHGQAIDSRGRVHVVMRLCTDESLAAIGSEPGESRWGPRRAWRYMHYWRDASGSWRENVLPVVAGSRPKVAACSNDNLILVYGAVGRESCDSGGLGGQAIGGDMVIAGATCDTGWTDWQVIHTEPGPFLNEMLIDPNRWAVDGILSTPVQESPSQPCDPTRLRVLEFDVGAKL